MGLVTGTYIDQNLSDYLKEYTSKFDRIKIYNETGVSDYLIKDLMYQTRKITDNNRTALIKLIQAAVFNAESRIKDSRTCKKNLTKILDTI